MFLNIESFVTLLTIVMACLFISGTWIDFIRSFVIAFSPGRRFMAKTVKKAILAVDLVIRICLLSGILCFLACAIIILSCLGMPEKIGPPASMALLANVYAVFAIILLLSLKARLTKVSIESQE